MPSSTEAGKPMIKKIINAMIDSSDFRILDVGCGKGTYGKLIEKPCKKVALDAVDYSQKFGLLNIYDRFVVADVKNQEAVESLGYFNLVIMGDVLEHLTFSEARETLDFLEEMSEAIIVAVPYLYPQDGGKNHWETHKQPELTRNLFLERYPEFTLIKEYTHKGMPFYGYFIWRK